MPERLVWSAGIFLGDCRKRFRKVGQIFFFFFLLVAAVVIIISSMYYNYDFVLNFG